MKINVANWVKSRVASGVKDFMMSGYHFEFLPLSEDSANIVASEDTYEEAMATAVKLSLCIDGELASKDEQNAKAVESFCIQPDVVDSEPCILDAAGRFVCDITDMQELTDVIDELQKQAVVEGDDLPKSQEDITIGQLNDDARHALNG